MILPDPDGEDGWGCLAILLVLVLALPRMYFVGGLVIVDGFPVNDADFPLIGFLRHFSKEPVGSRGLEIGANECFCSGILQARGYQMTGVDARNFQPETSEDYCINWKQVRAPVERALPFLEPPYDFLVSLSAIEHFGLDYYGEGKQDNGDRRAMELAREWVKPDGLFYLTIPTGTRRITEHWRRYDEPHFTELIKDLFEVTEVRVLSSWNDVPPGAYVPLEELRKRQPDWKSLEAAWTWDGGGCNYAPLFLLRPK